MTLSVCGVRRCSGRTAPNGRAAGSVGNIHSVAEKLGYETGIRGLGTARAGAGEFKKRLSELRSDNIRVCSNILLFTNLGNTVIEGILLGKL